MSVDRRQVHRRKPIVVVLDSGEEFSAEPLPWQKRNDLGQAIVTDNVAQTNKQLRMFVDPELSVPQIEAMLNEPLSDFPQFLVMGYPGTEVSDYDECSYGELVELLAAVCEVNELSKLRRLFDPNYQTPTTSTGETSSAEGILEQMMTGEKIQSSVDSSSSDSDETTSSTSPTQKS
jgi:hypothetical protein